MEESWRIRSREERAAKFGEGGGVFVREGRGLSGGEVGDLAMKAVGDSGFYFYFLK